MYPQHRLIEKMVSSIEQSGLTLTTLETWVDRVKDQFNLDNAVFLPTDDLDPEGRIRVRDVSDFMSRSADHSRTQEILISEMRTKIHSLSQEVQSLRESNVALHKSNESLHTKIDILLSRASPGQSNFYVDGTLLSDSSSSSPQQVEMSLSTPSPARNRSLIDSFFPHVDGTSSAVPPLLDDRTMRTQTLSSVFFDWYKNERYNHVPEVGSRAKFIFNEIWKTIAHLRRFLPPGHSIQQRPTAPEAVPAWTLAIQNAARVVESKAVTFMSDKAFASGVGKKRRIEPTFAASYKRFMKIDPLQFPSPINVTDTATPLQFQKDIASFRKVSRSTNNKRSGLRDTNSSGRFAAANGTATDGDDDEENDHE